MLSKLIFYTSFIFVFIIVGFIVDIYLTFVQLNEHNGLIAYGYMSLYLVLISLIAIYIFKFILEFRKYPILDYNEIEEFRNFKNKNNLFEKKKLLERAIQLLSYSQKEKDGLWIKQKVQRIHSQMMVSNSSEKDYYDLYEISVEIDKEAKKIIIEESVNIALMTGISQKSSLDMLIVLYKNISLIRTLLKLYGYRPNIYNTIILTKKVIENTFVAGAMQETNTLLEGIGGAVGTFFAGSAINGITNGMLSARVGNTCKDYLSLTKPDSIKMKEVVIEISTKSKNIGLTLGDKIGNFCDSPDALKLRS